MHAVKSVEHPLSRPRCVLRWDPIEDYFVDPPIEDKVQIRKIKLPDGVIVPIRPIYRFNSFVYRLEQVSSDHPYLPQQFIFKMPNPERFPDRHETDDLHEMQIYERLKPLQGRYIPCCYGEASCFDDSGIIRDRGIILEILEGTTLCSLQELSPQMKRAIIDSACQAVQKIAFYDVVHSDLKLDNLVYIEQRVMVIDFDVSEISKEEWYAYDVNLNDLNIYLEKGGFHTRYNWTPSNKMNLPPPKQPVSDDSLTQSTAHHKFIEGQLGQLNFMDQFTLVEDAHLAKIL